MCNHRFRNTSVTPKMRAFLDRNVTVSCNPTLIARKIAQIKVISENYMIRCIERIAGVFEMYRFGLKTVILTENIQQFSFANTSILPRTGIIAWLKYDGTLESKTVYNLESKTII